MKRLLFLAVISAAIAASAQNWSAPVAVTTAAGDDHHVCVGQIGYTDSLLLAWDRTFTGNTDIYARTFHPESGQLGDEIRVTNSDAIEEKAAFAKFPLGDDALFFRSNELGNFAYHYSQYMGIQFGRSRRVLYSDNDLDNAVIREVGELGSVSLLCHSDSCAIFQNFDPFGIPQDSVYYQPDTGSFPVSGVSGYWIMYSGSWLDFLRWVWVVEISGQTEIAYSLDGFGGYPPICYSGLVPNNGFNYHHPELQGFTLYLERESGTSCDIARAVFNSSLGIWSMPEPLFAGIGNEWNPHGQGQDIIFEADWNGNSDIAFWSPIFETPEFVDTDPAEDRNPVIYLFFWPTAGLHAFWESNRDGNWKIYHSLRAIVGVEPIFEQSIPGLFAISVHPNPGNAEFRIDLELPMSGEVAAAIYDLSGRRVAKIHDGVLPAGSQKLSWDASDISSGIYLLRVENADKIQTRKVVVLK